MQYSSTPNGSAPAAVTGGWAATGAGAGLRASAAARYATNHVLSDIDGDKARAALAVRHQQQHALAAALLWLPPRRPGRPAACAPVWLPTRSTTSPGCMPLSAASLSGSTLVTTHAVDAVGDVEVRRALPASATARPRPIGVGRWRRRRRPSLAGVVGRRPCLSGRVPILALSVFIGLPWRDDGEGRRLTRRHSGDLAGQIARIVVHRLAVDRDDDVALLEAGLGGRAARHDFGDDARPWLSLMPSEAAISGVTLWMFTPR